METGLNRLLTTKKGIQEKIAILNNDIKEIDVYIGHIVQDSLDQARAVSGKDFGVVSIMVEDVEVKETLSKTVTWDQDILKGIVCKIRTAGEDPSMWIDEKYVIPEIRFSGFVDKVKALLLVARTVKAGKPKLTFKIKGE